MQVISHIGELNIYNTSITCPTEHEAIWDNSYLLLMVSCNPFCGMGYNKHEKGFIEIFQKNTFLKYKICLECPYGALCDNGNVLSKAN